MRRSGAWLFALLLGACGPTNSPPIAAVHAPPKPPPPPATATATASAAATTEPAPEPLPEGSATPEDAERVLFLATDLRTDNLRKTCPVTLAPAPRIRCLLSLRYIDDRESEKLALTLYAETGSLAGLLPEETSDDGHGGKVHLLPARPVDRNREHLTWIIGAFRDYKRFLDGISTHLGPGAKVAFRDRPVDFRFFYSEKGGHPSAFAVRRNIGYNLFGALNVSDSTVRDTLFHEIFHLNDSRLGDVSSGPLAALRDSIVAKCGKRVACLTPYSPTDTRMFGGFYAFTDASGAREYAAELGLRYYREHRLLLEGKPLPVKPFKCGPPENAAALRLIADAFFGGVDLVPPC
ncbi:MAG: hypothetical protein U0441_16715 [Polyangiaceae bacterium]